MSKILQEKKGISISNIKISALIVFSFLLEIMPALSQVRGPYLQSGTSTSMVIRWRTDVATNSQVRYGTVLTQLTNIANNLRDTIEHEVKLSALTPLTKYYYSIGSTASVLQGDTANYFYTLPAAGATGLVRIGVLGDCGDNSTNQLQVRDQLKNYLGSNYMNAWILLGDNAYNSGTDAEYQAEFFNIYRDYFLKQNPLYSSPGNHDYAEGSNGSQDSHDLPYYSVYSMPINGEGGGVPSNNKAYYSFNVGNIHFLSLDSYGREDNATRLYDTLGKQVQWVKQDLAANTNKGWVVAFWHHPPYTKGSHDSDNEASLIGIRNNFIRILERLGVDLVLCGHSHVYERSKLQFGHYGTANTFDPSVNNLSTSSGLYDGTSNSCPYFKDTINRQQGIVYVVSGSAGHLGGQQSGYPHNAMYYSNNTIGGSMMLEVQGNRLDAKWICSDGVIRDRFTMMKNVSKRRDTTINTGDAITLTASYIGNYTWQPGSQTTRSITVSPTPGVTRYIVKDSYSCIADTFNITAASILPLTWGPVKGWYSGNNTIQIQWQTLLEKNSHYFEIERSTDGTHFSLAGTVNASGNGSSSFTYQFADKNVAGNIPLYYYRIKQIDNNTNFSYSPVISVKPQVAPANVDVQIVPNPGRSNEMKIRLLGSPALKATIALTDVSGRTIMSRIINLTPSLQSFMPIVQSGTYFLNINIGSTTITRQIIINK